MGSGGGKGGWERESQRCKVYFTLLAEEPVV